MLWNHRHSELEYAKVTSPINASYVRGHRIAMKLGSARLLTLTGSAKRTPRDGKWGNGAPAPRNSPAPGEGEREGKEGEGRGGRAPPKPSLSPPSTLFWIWREKRPKFASHPLPGLNGGRTSLASWMFKNPAET